MKKKIYTITKNDELNLLKIRPFKRAVLTLALLSMIGPLFSQGHDHENDTVAALSRNSFNAHILSSSNNILDLEVFSNLNDSLTPVFIELSANGFEFTPSCVVQQSINNVNVESNIEKILGPKLVSLGLIYLPPNGKFKTTLSLMNDFPSGSFIKVRIFGEVNGQDILWSAIIKK